MDTEDALKQGIPPIQSITFSPAPHAVESFEADVGLSVSPGEDPRLALLRSVAPQQHERCSELLHSSLSTNPDAMQDILPLRNGFVHTVTMAYSQHRALIVRPDDVWLAILMQFCFFVNGNAEALRASFVAQEERRELVIESIANRYTMDPAQMARQMTELMKEHIIDESLREWIIPSFSTTTMTDKSISAIVMMGTMKEYFAYKFRLKCGIPRVTLEGEEHDWEEILRRLERLKMYGSQTTAWYHLLQPIISRFIAAYDDPASQSNLDFWNQVAHWSGLGSGVTWLSGWITAFCMFNEKGQWQGSGPDTEQLSPGDVKEQLNEEEFPSHEKTLSLVLDGILYPKIDSDNLPCAYAYVDVTLSDNGVLFDTMFVAGFAGSQISSTERAEPVPKDKRNSVQPFSAWWYFIKGDKPQAEVKKGKQSRFSLRHLSSLFSPR